MPNISPRAEPPGSRRIFRAATLAALLGLSLACGSEGDRANQHLQRADKFLAEERGREALIELHNAALLRPNDAELAIRVADLSLRHGFFGDAADFYRDALALRPQDNDTALKLAQLLLELDPEESRARIDELIARKPRLARAWLVRARASVIDGDMNSAMSFIANARNIDPREAEIDRVMALFLEARGRAAMARNPLAIPAPRVTESILRAYDRYLANGGDYPLLGFLGRARTLARLADRLDEAAVAFELALDKSAAMGSPYERLRVAREAARFARLRKDRNLEHRAVNDWIKFAPEDLMAWRALTKLETEDPVAHAKRSYRRLVDALADVPAAHGLYAEHILDTQGYAPALSYLEQKLSQGEDDAAFLIAIVNLQNRAERYADAARTVNTLRVRFPDLPASAFALGEQQVIAANYAAASETLRSALKKQANSRGYRALARAEQKRGRLPEALEAINQSIALEGVRAPESLRLKAQILSEMGKYKGQAATLLALRRMVGLTPGEQLSLASSYYDRNAPGIGRKILLSLLSREEPGARAALEFARYDGDNPQHRPAVRQHLERALERFPAHMKLLEALTELDTADGRIDAARRRLDASVESRSWLGGPYIVRAKLLLELGEFIAARDDAERALMLDPSTLDAAYDIMTIAYMNDGNVPELVRSMETKAPKEGLSADRSALLARLTLSTGNVKQAMKLYDRALTQGSGLLFVKNDLAFLLASTGGDLDRALSLAKQATEAPGENVTAVDTLGYVYLKQGRPEAAVWQFRQAVAEAEPPVADYYHHLGLALFELGKPGKAREAFETALGLDPAFAGAQEAREKLTELPAKDSAS